MSEIYSQNDLVWDPYNPPHPQLILRQKPADKPFLSYAYFPSWEIFIRPLCWASLLSPIYEFLRNPPMR